MDEGNIMIITSNARGGIAQFAFFLATEMRKNARVNDVVLLVPRDSEYSVSAKVKIEFYDKVETIVNDEKKHKEALGKIEKHHPSHIIFAELSTSNIQLASLIKGKYHLSVVLHDALKKIDIDRKEFFGHMIFRHLLDKNIGIFDKIVVLSEAVLKEMNKRYKIKDEHVIRMKLCSHLHVPKEFSPSNMIGEDYFLFFGQIKEYKGLETLFEAYASDKNRLLPKLVVAGKGDFTKKEKKLFEQIKNNVILMKRYITDETLASLMTYSKAVILPYKEATQSGVIPMAYQFSKPVVVTNAGGLHEDVIEDVTGAVINPKDSVTLYSILRHFVVREDVSEEMIPAIQAYYANNFNWSKHVDHLIDRIMD